MFKVDLTRVLFSKKKKKIRDKYIIIEKARNDDAADRRALKGTPRLEIRFKRGLRNARARGGATVGKLRDAGVSNSAVGERRDSATAERVLPEIARRRP